jgi:pimeloyl-ACP methyl ester carboxylesterase
VTTVERSEEIRPSDSGRARLPDRSGFAERPDGVRIAFDVYGSGDPTILFMPSAPIIHSRQWKGQVPYLSLRHRVITYDGRGNGRSDRPGDSASYAMDRILGDVEGVLDATETERAILVGLCGDSVWPAVQFAAARPDRVLGIVAFAVGVPRLTPPHPWRAQYSFDDDPPADDGWALINRHVYRRDYAAFARFFFGALATEPHSTKLVEDTVGWALYGSPEAMIADADVELGVDREGVEAVCAAVRCPMLLVHGTDDVCQPPSRARRLAEITGARLVEVEGAGHLIPGRHPVLANLLIRDFVSGLPTGGNER